MSNLKIRFIPVFPTHFTHMAVHGKLLLYIISIITWSDVSRRREAAAKKQFNHRAPSVSSSVSPLSHPSPPQTQRGARDSPEGRSPGAAVFIVRQGRQRLRNVANGAIVFAGLDRFKPLPLRLNLEAGEF